MKTRVALLLFLSAAFAALTLPLGAQTVLTPITRDGFQPSAVAVYEAGNKVFVADIASGSVYMFDGTTHVELASVSMGGAVDAMAVHQGSGRLFVVANATRKIAVIDAATGSLIEFLTLTYTNLPTLAVDETANRLWVTSYEGLRRIDVNTDVETTVSGVAIGDGKVMAVNSVTHEVFVSEYQGFNLRIVDGSTLAVTTVPNLGGGLGIGVNPAENKVYIGRGTAGTGAVSYDVYDRDTGVNTHIYDANDASQFVFDAVRNRMVTGVEVNGYSTIIEANDAFSNLPLESPANKLALVNATGHVYYAGNKSVLMVDQATRVVERIPVPNPTPGGVLVNDVAINQSNGRVYVITDGPSVHQVIVIQDTPALTRPPLYAATGFGGAVHIVDPVTMTALWTSAVANETIAVMPGGGRAYAPKFMTTALTVVEGTWLSAHVDSIPIDGSVFNSAEGIVASPDGSRLYVCNYPNFVNVIDVATKSYSDIVVGSTPWGAAITPDGSRVLVTNKASNTVSVIATATNTVMATINVGSLPYGIAVHPAGRLAFVANSGSGTVSILDLDTNQVKSTVTVGATPHWVATTPDGRHVYVSNRGGGTVTVFNADGGAVVQTVTMPAGVPEGIAAHPDGSTMYVVGYVWPGNSSIVTIDTSSFAPVAHPLDATASGGTVGIAMTDLTARFAGRIGVQGGGGLAGATVRALQSGVEMRSATTSSTGDFVLANLESGTYDIEVSKNGYVTALGTGLVGLRGRITLWNATLDDAGCRVETSPKFINVSSAATAGSIAVTAASTACGWTATVPIGSFVSITGGASGSGSGTVSYSVAQNSSTAARSTTISIGGAAITITQGGSGAAAISLNAVASSNSVALSWTPVAGASYEVWRSSGAAFVPIGATSSLSMTDTGVSAGAAFLYRVLAVNGGTIGYSNVDLAVVLAFDTLSPGVTVIGASHLARLRSGVNAARSVFGWSAASFTDPAPAGLPIRAYHITQLRSSVDGVRAAAGLAPGVYTDVSIVAGVTPVRAAHFTDLRDALR